MRIRSGLETRCKYYFFISFYLKILSDHRKQSISNSFRTSGLPHFRTNETLQLTKNTFYFKKKILGHYMVETSFRFFPLTPSRWPDFEELFGSNGACGGCWCTTWRLSNKEFQAGKGEGNKNYFHTLVDKKKFTGILAYDGKKAVGWISFSPREQFPRLENSRVLKPVDAEKVWSVTCFFILKKYRHQGLSVKLLKAAADICRKKGVKILEGYPSIPYGEKTPDVFVWTGLHSTFIKAGFKEAARRSPHRPVMRLKV